MADKISIVVTLITLLLVMYVGGVVLGEFDSGLTERQAALHDRAEKVYGPEYVIVSSGACWDTCAPTATTRGQQQADLLYALEEDGGWVSEFELVDRATGFRVDEPLAGLVERGVVERRTADNGIWPSVAEYRYVGEAAPEPLSEAALDARVRDRLYLTGTYMSAGEIAADLPVSTARVEASLRRLEARGVVDSGYASPGVLPSWEMKYIDARHGSLPDTWWKAPGLFGVLIVNLVAVVVVGGGIILARGGRNGAIDP